MSQTTKTLAALVASVAIVASSTTLAAAAPNYRTLPELPSSTLRATTQGTGQAATSIADAIIKNGTDPVAPKGVNDWNCTPNPKKPNSVILIHGMFMTANTAWAGLGPVLKDQGYCVYAVNLPKDPKGLMSKAANVVGLDFGGLSDIDAASVFTAAFVNEVMKTTGAKKVNLVGYSEGGTISNLIAHTYGPSFINKIVTMAGINVGINPLGVQNNKALWTKPDTPAPLGKMLNKLSVAAGQMMSGSSISERLTKPDTVPGITYTNISSKHDEFVLMSTHNPNFQKAVPGATVTNITLQDGCSKDRSDHLTVPFNKRVWALTINALAGSQVQQVPCLVAIPLLRSVDAK
ncbi:MAG: alpha/beta fold hydrolase [Lawsonella sp.]|uniref:esterase/lipase family protein n=1 Tax=Lawsonella sp. TaxID=2041415 RepID=UPI002A7526FD|nr:alpha/beta fold hydrolase [Lawsonella sp.]MDY2978773.1 alpha/beta fold hydrolase [Lawsonella sp.]